jgi:hypothetical protein
VLLKKLRDASIQAIPEITWTAAGVKLLEAYRQVMESKQGVKG